TATNIVTLTISSGTFAGTSTVSKRAIAGVATFDDLGIVEVGVDYTLTATGTPDASNTAIGPATSVKFENWATLVFDVEPSDADDGVVIAPPIVVEIWDSSNEVAVTATDDVTLEIASGTGTLGGTLTQPAVAGVATFDDITVTLTAGADQFTLEATGTGLVTGTSATFDVPVP
ncbi:unnamed protein product, partial [marine sediment metagenome]